LITSIFAKLSSSEFPFPKWVKNFGAVLSLTPISFIVGYFVYKVWAPKGSIKEVIETKVKIPLVVTNFDLQKLLSGFTPHEWGPAHIMDRERWQQYIKPESK
jgi:hypothetical protein